MWAATRRGRHQGAGSDSIVKRPRSPKVACGRGDRERDSEVGKYQDCWNVTFLFFSSFTDGIGFKEDVGVTPSHHVKRTLLVT
jgi:hypothetical protein